jgi:UDP-glucose:(heptosyl)LPS alpha-1,3-glucosyltransferase
MKTNEEHTAIAVIRSSYSAYGGVERTAVSMVKGLLEVNVKVSLLTWPQQDWPLSDNNLHLVHLGTHRGNRFLKAWLFERAVKSYLSNHRFTCILALDRVSQFTHLHAGGGTHKSFLQIKNRHSGLLARSFRKMSLFHAYTLYLEKKGLFNPRLKKIRCNSHLVKDDISRNYHVDQNKLQVIYSSIDWKGIGESFTRRSIIAGQLYKRHNLSPEWNYLLFLGSGFSRKGLDIVIEGLQFLPDSYHVLVVGDGSQRPYLDKATRMGLSHRVHFLGPQEKGWKYASICRALVLPSRYDPFGGAAAEAHAMGLPVMVSDKTGYAEWVMRGKNGVILETPATRARIKNAFTELVELIDAPTMTPSQIRDYNRNLDNDVISKKLISEFLGI